MIVISGDFNACLELTPTSGIQSLVCMGWVKSMRVGNVCLISVSPTNSSVPIPSIGISLNTSVFGTKMVTMSWSVPSTAPPVLARMEFTINQTMSSLYPPFVSNQNKGVPISSLLFSSDQVSSTRHCLYIPYFSSSCLITTDTTLHIIIQVPVQLMLLMSGPLSKLLFWMLVAIHHPCLGRRRLIGSLKK